MAQQAESGNIRTTGDVKSPDRFHGDFVGLKHAGKRVIDELAIRLGKHIGGKNDARADRFGENQAVPALVTCFVKTRPGSTSPWTVIAIANSVLHRCDRRPETQRFSLKYPAHPTSPEKYPPDESCQ